MHEVDLQHLIMSAGDFSGAHSFFDDAKARGVFSSGFPIGPREGGAVIDFGNAIQLECFIDFKLPSGVVLPFVPLPLDGAVVHDIGRKREVALWEIENCLRRRCRCKSRPTGWRLTSPIVRALLRAG